MRALLTTFLVVAIACSGGGTNCTDCTGGVQVPYPNPAPKGGEVQTDAARARLTGNLLEFLRVHLGALLGSYFQVENNRVIYYLDESLLPKTGAIFIRDACIGEPDSPCPTSTNPCPNPINPAAECGRSFASKISFDLNQLTNNLSLTWLEANTSGQPGIHVSLKDMDLFVDLGLVINVPSLLGVAACHVQDQTGLPAIEVKELAFDLRLSVDKSGAAPKFIVAQDNVIVDFGDAADDSALHLSVSACDGAVGESCSDPRCLGADPQGQFAAPDCPGVCGLLDLFSQIGGFVTQIARPIMAAMGPNLAEAVADILAAALDQIPLKVETRFTFQDSNADLLLGVKSTHLKVEASSQVKIMGTSAGRGLDLGLDVGVGTPLSADCARNFDPPDLSLITGPPPNYTGFIEVFDSLTGDSHFELYHAAIGVSEVTITQLLWSMFKSGMVCLNLDSETVAGLTAGKFALTAGLLMNFDTRLSGLTDPAAPLLVTFTATQTPTIRLGTGGAVGAGVEDPLVEAVLNDAQIDIYVQLDDSLMRLVGMSADLFIRLGVERMPDHSLEVVLAGIETADIWQTYNDIVPTANLSDLLKLLTDLAISQFLSEGVRFEINVSEILADKLAIPLWVRLNGVRRDVGPTGTAYASLFATICDANQIADPTNYACFLPGGPTGQIVHKLTTNLADEKSLYQKADPERFPPDRWFESPSGQALLKVNLNSTDVDTNTAIFQYRVDSGPWSAFIPATSQGLWVKSPRLNVLGYHYIDVRARSLGNYAATSNVASLTVLVDRERPCLKLWRQGDLVSVEVNDLGTPELVETWARFGNGSTTFNRCEREIDVTGESGMLEVYAQDAAGNVSALATLELGSQSPAAEILDGKAAKNGCSSTGNSGTLWILSALLALTAVRRLSKNRS